VGRYRAPRCGPGRLGPAVAAPRARRMMRLAAVVLLAVLAALPLAVRPSSPPVTWLATAALVVGGVGVIAWSVPLVTAAGSLVLIAYALALVLAGPAADPLAALALGSILVLLLALVHFAGRARGAALGPSVIASQVRQWLAVVGLGTVAAVVLTAAAAPLGVALRSATLPVVVIAAALGAVLTVAGVIALLAREASGGPMS